MTLKNKIISGITALGITGAGVVGVNEACIDSKGITMFPAETMAIYEEVDDKVQKINQVCFNKQGDYTVYREYYIDTYLGMTGQDRALWLRTEGAVLDDILTHEIKKRGVLSFPYTEDDDIFLKIIDELKL